MENKYKFNLYNVNNMWYSYLEVLSICNSMIEYKRKLKIIINRIQNHLPNIIHEKITIIRSLREKLEVSSGKPLTRLKVCYYEKVILNMN